MDAAGFAYFDPAVLDGLRDAFAGTLDFLQSYGAPSASDVPHLELAQAATPEGANPTAPPDRRVTENSIDVKNAGGVGGNPAAPVDFSIGAVVMRADPIGKAVIAVLVLASVWSWAIIFEKWFVLRSINY